VGAHFVSTKQDVFFFGTPVGDYRYDEGNLPVWADHSDHFMYGIPGIKTGVSSWPMTRAGHSSIRLPVSA